MDEEDEEDEEKDEGGDEADEKDGWHADVSKEYKQEIGEGR